jgi:hypothetical protein
MIIDDIFYLPVTKKLSPLVNICSFLFSHHPAQNRTSFKGSGWGVEGLTFKDKVDYIAGW